MPPARYSTHVYLAIAVVAVTPIPCALIGDWLQHTFLPEVYWALPISVASFYTSACWAICLLGLGLSAGTWHWSMRWGVVSAVVYAGARIVYWWPSRLDHERGTVAALIDARLSSHAVGNWGVIAIGLVTYICLSVATKQILSAHGRKTHMRPQRVEADDLADTTGADAAGRA